MQLSGTWSLQVNDQVIRIGTQANRHWGSTVLSLNGDAVNGYWRQKSAHNKNRRWGWYSAVGPRCSLQVLNAHNSMIKWHGLTQKELTRRINRVIIDRRCIIVIDLRHTLGHKNRHWGSAVLSWTGIQSTGTGGKNWGTRIDNMLIQGFLERDAVSMSWRLAIQCPSDTDWLNKNLQWLIVLLSTGDVSSRVIGDTDWRTSKYRPWGSFSSAFLDQRWSQRGCRHNKLTRESALKFYIDVLDQVCCYEML
jgi:hypothetical protein